MEHESLDEERLYLKHVIDLLKQELSIFEEKITNRKVDIDQSVNYLWQNIYELDPEEIASMHVAVDTSASLGENIVHLKNNIKRLIPSPYFGRIDFKYSDNGEIKPVYIGMNNFTPNTQSEPMIFDWRAPISGMFYDYELGDAEYETPIGKKEGSILAKRQYSIKNGKIEFMIESGLTVNDTILQNELNALSDNKMKGIVATIQREQNKIIRNDTTRNLIIQGAAGSGKSSIALHRAAFLLYRQKDKLTSKSILIISPNKVFADYMSSVLPSLGEEQISEVSFDDIAKAELKGICKYQTFFEQVESIISRNDNYLLERIRYKSSYEIINQIRTYVTKKKNNIFKPKSVKFPKLSISAAFVYQEYCRCSHLSKADIIEELTKIIQYKAERELKVRLLTEERKKIKNEVMSMFQEETILKMYENFYAYIGKPDYFKMVNNKIEFSDVFPLICMKILYGSHDTFSFVKHLIIDEMQDYTPIQYYVVSLLFKCNKTILGDSYQAITPYSSSAETISKVFPNSECVYLNRSYRSTFEIVQFAQKILKDKEIIPYERHGAEVKVHNVTSNNEQINLIKELIDNFYSKNTIKSIGIICKTQYQAKKLYSMLVSLKNDIYLIKEESCSFVNGVVVSSIHMSKGLEFDAVIVPDVSSDNYNNEMDRNLLYIACTRAMHYLHLTSVKEQSCFILNL